MTRNRWFARANSGSTAGVALCAVALLAGCVSADQPRSTGEPVVVAEAGAVTPEPCGPQSGRDISVAGGTNELPVPGDGTRPQRLCNVHFHRPAEHAGIGACPTVAQEPAAGVCGGDGAQPVRPGDEIEVHWVYTSCPFPTERQPGLGNCVCDEPVLMVFGQKYSVAGDGDAGAEQALSEPAGDLARYLGSTTGAAYSGDDPGDPRPCSPARVQWAVAQKCRAISLSALGDWCAGNEWGEDSAHGIRDVITREDWLSPYVPPGS